MRREHPTGYLAGRMADVIQVGDRVINLQVPGVFRVIARRGAMLEIETDQGLRLTVTESAVRRLDDGTPPPADEES